jgi:hypothetical protein
MTGDNGHRSASSALLDPDVNMPGIDEAELVHIETKLGELAASLTPDEAATEIKLRVEYIGAEKSLFSSRLERGIALAKYHALYAPLGKLSEFLRIVKVDRRTAYRLIDKAEAETVGCVKMTRSASKERKEPTPPLRYGFDIAVDKIVDFANRVVSRLPEAQRQLALDAAADRLGAGARPIHIVDKTIEAQSDSYQITSCVPVASGKSTEVAA